MARKQKPTQSHRAVAKGSTEKKGRKMRNHQDRAVAKGSTEKNCQKTSNLQMFTFEPPHLCTKVFFCNSLYCTGIPSVGGFRWRWNGASSLHRSRVIHV